MLTALGIAVGLLLAQPSSPAAPAPPVSAPSLPEVVRVAGRAVVSLRTYDVEGSPLGQGSGFLVEKGRVVTNAHVVQGATRVEVYDFENTLLGTTDYAESLSTRADLAVLPALARAPGELRLAAGEPPVGTSLVVIGAPEGLTNTVSTGIVSAFREREGQRMMQISAPISHGSSGGPVLDPEGAVVGVSVAILEVGQNLNFAIPGRDVRALLASPPGHIAFTGKPSADAASLEVTSATTEAPDTSKPTFRDALATTPRLTVGKLASGTLSADDYTSSEGRHGDVLHSEGKAGEVYTVMAGGSAFAARLVGVGLNARGESEPLGTADADTVGGVARLVLRLPRDGVFAVMVLSVSAGATGEYTVGILRGDVPVKTDTGTQALKDGRWSRVARSSDTTMYIDRKTARRTSAGAVQVWTWSVHDRWEGRGKQRYNNSKSLQEYDCDARQYRILSQSRFAKETFATGINTPSDWVYWLPGSVGETMATEVCALALE